MAENTKIQKISKVYGTYLGEEGIEHPVLVKGEDYEVHNEDDLEELLQNKPINGIWGGVQVITNTGFAGAPKENFHFFVKD